MQDNRAKHPDPNTVEDLLYLISRTRDVQARQALIEKALRKTEEHPTRQPIQALSN